MPAGGLEIPAVLAVYRDESVAVLLRGGMRRLRPDRGRVVADVVIAGQIAAVGRQAGVQALCKFEIGAAGRAIPSDVAAVDDEVGAGSRDVLAHAMKVVGQYRQAAGEVGVGNLGQAK